MKKIFFSVALVSSALTASSQTASPTSSLITPGTYTPGTYYGTKAGDGMFNPCKGKTIRVCAEIKVITGLDTDFGTNTLSLDDDTSASETSSSIEWRVPLNTSEADFARIKAWELAVPNLKVIKGLEGETDGNDSTEE